MWYYAANNLTHGPVSEQELHTLLKRKTITTQTLVWRDDAPEHLPLEKTELAAKFDIPLPDGERWYTCAFSGQTVRESEMCVIDRFPVANACRAEAQAFADAGGWLGWKANRNGRAQALGMRRSFREMCKGIAKVVVPACALYLLFNVPLQFGLAWVNARLGTVSQPVFALELVVQVVVLSLPMAALLFLFKEDAHRRRPGFGKALGVGLSLWGRMALVNLFILVAASGWWASHVLRALPGPGGALLGLVVWLVSLYAWLRLAYACVIVVEGETTPWAALKSSWRLRGARETTTPAGRSLSSFHIGLNTGLDSDLPLIVGASVIISFAGLETLVPSLAEGAAGVLLFSLRGLFMLCYIQMLAQFYTEREKRTITRQPAGLAA